MQDGKNGGGPEVVKSQDPGETLEEAGLEGDSGPEIETDAKDQDAEPVEGGDADSDGGGEGEEVDRDRGSDAEKGEQKAGDPSEVDAVRELLKQRETELSELKKQAEQAQAAPQQAPPQMTEEQWAAVEERFGGMPRTQIQSIADFMDRQAQAIEAKWAARFAAVEKEMVINRLSESDGFRDIRAHRQGVEEFLKNFNPSMHSDEKLLKMAVAYARGLRASEAAKKPGASKERNLRVVGAARPNTGGGSAGGSTRGFKLTAQERQAAKLGGMTEQEYHAMKYGGRRK